tara:strand:- start:8805 stop:9500 length:696 start_codon:yes stop_codon:yes gene_type:complete
LQFIKRNKMIKKKYLFIIPARKGSTRIKNKNIKYINNKPLIYWTLKNLYNFKKKYEIIISTNDQKIKKIAKNLKFEVPFLRPKKLATKSSKIIHTIKHAIRYYEKKEIYFENICLLQVTSPLRNSEDIKKCIKIFEKNNSDSLITVFDLFKTYKKKLFYMKYKNKIKTHYNKIKNKLYVMNGPAILITKTNCIMKNKLYGKNISYYEMPYYRSFDINVYEDLKICEVLNEG